MTAIEPTPTLHDQALEILKNKQDFRAHLLVYTLVNSLLWVIWLITGAGFPWPIFPALIWGVGLVMNAWEVFWRRPITEREIEREMRRLSSQS